MVRYIAKLILALLLGVWGPELRGESATGTASAIIVEDRSSISIGRNQELKLKNSNNRAVTVLMASQPTNAAGTLNISGTTSGPVVFVY